MLTNNITYYFYIITRDYGFAPNPFYGFCTLACCKSQIRKKAQKGDWVIGLGSKKLKCRGEIIYAMKVTEMLTFNEYYKDKRFSLKKPYISGSLKTMHGDNVYHKNSKGQWIQDDCHHNHKNKTTRSNNIKMDTKVNRVLVSDHFFYFGNNPLSGSSALFDNIKSKTELLGPSYNELEEEGEELVKFLKENKKTNFIYGEPTNWNHKCYREQLNKSK